MQPSRAWSDGFTFEVCADDKTGHTEIPLEAFHVLQPLHYQPVEWVQPTDRGDKRPTVINNLLIQNMYKKYSTLTPHHNALIEAGDDIQFDEMKELKLEYSDILHIENLQKCSHLKSLSLNNNILETPFGLWALVHLEELDLSYNRLINLNSIHLLKKLRVLRLNNNLLQSIAPLKYNYRTLEVLTLANNKLSDFCETLLYLTALPNLKSLTLDGNPLWGETPVNKYLKMALFHHMPQLRFYEHRVVTSWDCYPNIEDTAKESKEAIKMQMLKKVFDDFKKEDPNLIQRLNSIRDGILRMDEDEEREYNDVALNSVLDQLCLAGFRYGKGFHALMENDPDGRDLISISKRIKDEVFERLNESMEPIIIEITRAGVAFHGSRQNCIYEYSNRFEEMAINYIQTFNSLVENFSERMKDVEKKLWKAYNSDNSSEEQAERNMKEVLLYDKEFTILTKELWWALMTEEMTIYGNLEDLFEAFEDEASELIRIYLEPFQERVVKLRKVEDEFFEYLMEFASTYAYEITKNKRDSAKLSEHHKKILFNTETRNNIIAQCHDNHATFIDLEEEKAIMEARKWLENLVESCRRLEAENNREKVDEINKMIIEYKSTWDTSVGEAIQTAYTFLWVIDPQWTKDIMYFKMNYEDRRLFDELESNLKHKTLEAIETRRDHEIFKELTAFQEEKLRTEKAQKQRLNRLKSMGQIHGSPNGDVEVKPEIGNANIMKQMSMLKEIDVNFEEHQNIVLDRERQRREGRRTKKEQIWKTQSDVENTVHFASGKNLEAYQDLKNKIAQYDLEYS